MQKHEIVIQKLILDIFNNKLRPATKLPPERTLATDLGIDRTSLRIALKQLESMKILEIRQGDGIYVKDYQRHAGIDFLRMLIEPKEDNGDDILFDDYLIEEIWNFWIEFMPLMLSMAMDRITPMEIKQFIHIFDEELENLDDGEKIVQLEAESQELVAEKTGNLIILLIANSTRKMRLKLIRLFISNMNREEIKRHVEAKRNVMRGRLSGDFIDTAMLAQQYKEQLIYYRNLTRNGFKTSPPGPDSELKRSVQTSK